MDQTSLIPVAVPDTPPILVTGATGFLGGHLVRALLARGDSVRALGRSPTRGLELAALGADFRPVDLRDRAAVRRACEGVGAVIHSGALSSAWGRRRDFYDTNVVGTEHVIAGCEDHGVRRLVHVSSPSVMSRHEVQLELDEAAPLPETFVSIYSETKALAEARVNEAHARGLDTVILRPKAIYGPGDTAIFPRIVDRLARGRLPIFGEGPTFTDITHVSDVVQACLLALARDEAVGGTYLITGGESVDLWEVIRVIAERLGHRPPRRRLPTKVAMGLGATLEALWRVLRLKGEPPLTRYTVSVLAFSQTYETSAARRDLGYEPKVHWREGIEDFLASLQAPTPAEGAPAGSDEAVVDLYAPGGARVELTLLSAGNTWAPRWALGHAGWKRVPVPARLALLEHPTYGPVLFDSGYSTHFKVATRRGPFLLYPLATPVGVTPEEDAASQLTTRGVDPLAVRVVVLSHLDPDHVGGLRDFPNARFVCSWRAWDAVAGKRGLRALKARYLPGLFPPDMGARLILLPDPAGPRLRELGPTLDLFGDGSLLLVSLPGHAPGHLGALIRPTEGDRVLMLGDACWTQRQIESEPIRHGLHRFICEDKPAQDITYRRLKAFHEVEPRIRMVPAHEIDPAALTARTKGRTT